MGVEKALAGAHTGLQTREVHAILWSVNTTQAGQSCYTDPYIYTSHTVCLYKGLLYNIFLHNCIQFIDFYIIYSMSLYTDFFLNKMYIFLNHINILIKN